MRVKIAEEDTGFGTVAYVIAYYNSTYRKWIDLTYPPVISEDFQGNRTFFLLSQTYYL